MKKIKNTLFFKPKHPSIAKKISIESPTAFKQSIKELKKNGLTKLERKCLILAQNRAKVQLHRKNLSSKERKQFKTIAKTKIPKQ